MVDVLAFVGWAAIPWQPNKDMSINWVKDTKLLAQPTLVEELIY